MPVKFGTYIASDCGTAAFIGRGAEAEFGTFVADRCGSGVIIEGQASDPSSDSDQQSTADVGSIVVTEPAKWQKTKRFLWDVGVGAVSAAIVQGAATNSAAL